VLILAESIGNVIVKGFITCDQSGAPLDLLNLIMVLPVDVCFYIVEGAKSRREENKQATLGERHRQPVKDNVVPTARACHKLEAFNAMPGFPPLMY
jgi:hypothetical protein